MKNLLSVIVFVGLVLLALAGSTNAQSVLLTVKNVTKVDAKNLTFEVWAKNNSAVDYGYYTGQFYLNYNKLILNSGTGTLSITASDLGSSFQPSVTSLAGTAANGAGQLVFPANAAPGVGTYYNMAAGSEVMVLRANLVTSVASFARYTPDITVMPGAPAGSTTNLNISVGGADPTLLVPPSDYTTTPTYAYAIDGSNPLLATASSTADGYQVQFTIKNVTQTMPNKLTYEIYIKNTGTAAYKYYTGQYFLYFNKSILNAGTGTLAVLASDLPSANATGSATVSVTGTPGQLRLSSKAGPGLSGGFPIAIGDEKLVARVELTTSAVAFTAEKPNIMPITVGGTGISLSYINAAGTGTTVLAALNATVYTDLSNPVLPVELQNFAATTKARDIELKWKTATEVNVNRFEVERSEANSTARTFKMVTKVNAAGNSNSPKDYAYTDTKLNTGKFSYRLKMIDNDGSFRYSKETESEVMSPKNFEMSQNYPNPFNPSTKIDYSLPVDAVVTLELYNINGQKISTLVNAQQTAGYHVYSLNYNSVSQGLASGMYVYRLSAQGKEQGSKFLSVKKMILLK